MLEFLTAVAKICSNITVIAAAACLFIKPARQWLLGERAEDDAIKCLLRSEMLRTYYHHRESRTIRQYEYENFVLMHKAYKARKGNTFIDHIKNEVEEWEVIS